MATWEDLSCGKTQKQTAAHRENPKKEKVNHPCRLSFKDKGEGHKAVTLRRNSRGGEGGAQ